MQTSWQSKQPFCANCQASFAGYLRAGARGFTLIEMMAVLVLMGLLTAVVLPNFERWFSGAQQRVGASELVIRLQKLYARAALLGLNFELNSGTASQKLPDGQPAFELPSGWAIANGQNLAISATGWCIASSIQFQSATHAVILDVKAENCDVSARPFGSQQ